MAIKRDVMNDEIPPPPDPKQLLREFELGAKKSFGQNFLRDQNMLRVIAEAAMRRAPQGVVVEIGAGLGALTYHLLAVGLRVIAIERDRDLVPILKREFAWAGDKLSLREMDAAKLDYQALAEELGGPVTMVGNLPYQISSRLLVGLAEAGSAVHASVVMVQKEVAERVVAVPRTKEYGLLSVLTQFAFAGEFVRIVPPEAFVPRPKIISAVIALNKAENAFDESDIESAIAAARVAFSTRRKTLRRILANRFRLKSEEAAKLIGACGFTEDVRAEEIDLLGFVSLGRVLEKFVADGRTGKEG